MDSYARVRLRAWRKRSTACVCLCDVTFYSVEIYTDNCSDETTIEVCAIEGGSQRDADAEGEIERPANTATRSKA